MQTNSISEAGKVIALVTRENGIIEFDYTAMTENTMIVMLKRLEQLERYEECGRIKTELDRRLAVI